MRESSSPSPGARVAARINIPAMGGSQTTPLPPLPPPLPAVKAGDLGRVVRLIHVRIEGEPSPGPLPSAHTLAHVLWDGAEGVMPLDPSMLRVVAETTEGSEAKVDPSPVPAFHDRVRAEPRVVERVEDTKVAPELQLDAVAIGCWRAQAAFPLTLVFAYGRSTVWPGTPEEVMRWLVENDIKARVAPRGAPGGQGQLPLIVVEGRLRGVN